MPYTNIVWIKLHLELFDEDDRFLFQLSERQQLLYIKLLYLAGRQKNKISKNPLLIIQKVNYQGNNLDLLGDIKTIKKVFTKFKENKYCYTFTKFEEIHNRITNGNSKGTPKELQRGILEEKREEEKREEYKEMQDFFSYFLLKTKKAFRLTDGAKDMIRGRLEEGYTLEQLKTAVDNFLLDDWVERPQRLDLIYCIGKQKGKTDALERWLNFTPIQKSIKPY